VNETLDMIQQLDTNGVLEMEIVLKEENQVAAVLVGVLLMV